MIIGWKSPIASIKVPPLPKTAIGALSMQAAYWRANYWKKFEEVEYYEPNKATLDEMVKNNLLDGPCTVCTGYGYVLCHCPLDFKGRAISHSRGRNESVYSVHTAPGGKTIRVPLHYGSNTGYSWMTSNYIYFGQDTVSSANLDDLVDHCLLDVEIEIEASL